MDLTSNSIAFRALFSRKSLGFTLNSASQKTKSDAVFKQNLSKFERFFVLFCIRFNAKIERNLIEFCAFLHVFFDAILIENRKKFARFCTSFCNEDSIFGSVFALIPIEKNQV